MARDAELRARITAKDDASKVIDKVADKADDLEKPVEVKVDADVRQVLSQLEDITSEAQATAVAAEELGRALGPELSAKSDLPALVNELKQMGITTEQVTANADELATQLKQASDADVGGKLGASLGTARGHMDEFAASAGSSKSVLANMVGNSAQDLGQLGGIAGSAGVAFGQMGEYMADALGDGDKLGDVLRNFGTVAVPVAALAAATQLVNEVMAARARASKQETAAIEAMSDALNEGGDAATAYAGELRDAAEIQGRFGKQTADDVGGITSMLNKLPGGAKLVTDLAGSFGLFGEKTDDLTDNLASAGVTVEQWSRAVTGGAPGLDKMSRALDAAGVSADEQKQILESLGNAQEDWATTTENGAAVAKVFGDTTEQTAAKLQAQEEATRKSEEATQAAAETQERFAEASQAAADALTAQADALNAQVDAATSAADQQLVVNDAMTAFADALKDSEASTGDQRDAAIDLAKATVELHDRQAEAAGTTRTSTERLDDQNAALLSTAATAKGPARSAILDYIGSVNQIPPEKVTEIQAAIAAGDLDTAKRLLDEASAPRKAAMQADAETAAAKRELDDAARRRDASIVANVSKGSGWGIFTNPFAGSAASASFTPGGLTATQTATVIPVTLKLPSPGEIARQIGRVRLPFSVASSLRADERLSGTRDL